MGTIIQLPVGGSQRLTLTYGLRRPRQTTTGFDSRPHFAATRKLDVDGTRMLVEVTGEVDLHTAPLLAQTLERARRDITAHAGVTEIVVDLRLVVFLSAAGLSVLARASHGCAQDDIAFRVAADQPAVIRPLTITRLDQQLRLRPYADPSAT